MSHPVDKLFKDKLADLEIPVSADAWQRVQHHRKNSRALFYQKWAGIAATVLMLIAAVFLINKNTLSVNSTSPDQTTAMHEPQELTDPASPVGTHETTSDKITEEIKDEPEATKQHIARTQLPPRVVARQIFQEEVTQGDADKTKKIVSPKAVHKLPELPEKMNVVAEVSIPDVPRVMLEKVAFPQHNTNTEIQPTLFDKITNTAREIKNNDGMMAELRELKDDVVSLEFFKTKKSI